LANKPGPKKVQYSIDVVCEHRGDQIGSVGCGSCQGNVKVKTFACNLYGSCTLSKATAGHKTCGTCQSYSPPPQSWVAPAGVPKTDLTWVGRCNPKPWEYKVAVSIPHLNSPDMLELGIEMWKHQTIRPYFLIIDTGSDPATCERLERMRSNDVEIHYIKGHGYRHSSAPVAAALDLSWALTRTDYSFTTHTDVFPMRRDVFEYLIGHISDEHPMAGWSMSPRDNCGDLWRNSISHTCSMWRMKEARHHGLTWSFERYYEENGYPRGMTTGWPDTESTVNSILKKLGVKPKLLGDEPNYRRHKTEWFDHARSYPGITIYHSGGDLHKKVTSYTNEVVADAKARLEQWKNNA
jgi:hypothetical protein